MRSIVAKSWRRILTLAITFMFVTSGSLAQSYISAASPVTHPRAKVGDTLSIVSLGDSIASGEGTRWGWEYDNGALAKTWDTKATSAPTWEGPETNCDRSTSAYPYVLQDLIANVVQPIVKNVTLTHLACSGASYLNGVVDPQENGSYPKVCADQSPKDPNCALPTSANKLGFRTPMGNQSQLITQIEHGAQVNPTYAAADPDIVTVSMGANDIEFSNILEDCVKSGLVSSVADAIQQYGPDSLARILDRVRDRARKGELDQFSEKATLDERCTAGHPGTEVEEKILSQICAKPKSGQPAVPPCDDKKWQKNSESVLSRNYEDLYKQIQDHSPKKPLVVFQTYTDPLPTSPWNWQACRDGLGYSQAQLDYNHALIRQLNAAIREGVSKIKDQSNVLMVDMESLAQDYGQQWCTPNPMFYGLGVMGGFIAPDQMRFGAPNRSPSHPTINGQQTMALQIFVQMLQKHANRIGIPG